ncbi:MAG: PLP-dependent aminotransferase family protein [Gemmatimonadetes bacterium]|nr:PLP-dependent aminotransferase family protein [Gemmatimonadota bacterium]
MRRPGVAAGPWLYAALRDAILGGQLRPGGRLPATRDLAGQAGVARGTVVQVFEQLAAEGYTAGAVGRGTFVSEVLPDDLLRAAPGPAAPHASEARARRLSRFARRARAFPGNSERPMRAFRANQPALDLFPVALWARLASRRLRQSTARQLLGCGPNGHKALQRAVADYLRGARGVRCVPAQVVITSGTQEALDLAARLFVDAGDRVVLEEPGYTGARLAFAAHGARIAGQRVDDEGMQVPRRAGARAKLAYVTPAHQFPLGTAMSLPRRLALLEWARAEGAMIVEDDYDSEYRFAGRPVPALQGLDLHGVTCFTGSFSKVLFPSLRLGYLVVPGDLVDAAAAIKSVTTRHPPVLDQLVLADFLEGGHFARHVRRMREVYAERLGVLLGAARAELAGLLDVSPIEAGLQTSGWLPPGVDGARASEAAAAHDVETMALSRFARGAMPRDGLQLGFAAVDPVEIRRGVTALARALTPLVDAVRKRSR